MSVRLDASQHRYLSFWFYTYADLLNNPKVTIEFIESTFEFGDPFGLNLRLSVNPHLNSVSSRRFSTKAWQLCKEELGQGHVRVLLTSWTKKFSAGQSIPHWLISLYPAQTLQELDTLDRKKAYWRLPAPTNLVFVIEYPPGTMQISAQMQNKIVRFARTAFVRLGATYGFVNFSNRSDIADFSGTEYENRLGVDHNVTSHLISERVRGAFWENYLTTEHVKRLGGIESIRANAPCEQIDVFMPKNSGVALRLTKNINEIGDIQVSQLEKYFAPLAP